MKSYREWKNLFSSSNAKEPQKDIKNVLKDPPVNCPFCKLPTVQERTDTSYYPNHVTVFQCTKCFRYWDNDKVEPRTAKNAAGMIENKLYTLFLSGVISESAYLENQQQQPVQQQPVQQQPVQQQPVQQQPVQQQQTDINQIAQQMKFQPTSKKKLMYQFAKDVNNMPNMSYAVAPRQMPIVTVTSDGKETQNTAEPNDIIVSGASGEKYVIKSAKFPKLYVGQIGGQIHPEQGPRNVAVYSGAGPINFKAPWGEDMVLKPGDYLVKEDEGKYYRIAKKEYELTYNPPGKLG